MARLTHGHPDALAATRYLAALLVGCLQGRAKAELLPADGLFCPTGDARMWDHGPLALTPAVRAAARSGGIAGRRPPRAGFDAVGCLDAALWAFQGGEDFAAAACRAANLGNDSDTVAAVAGQLAGAYWGEDAIPASWRAALVKSEWIGGLAERLLPS
jgi:ADP-ribosylglycohydrolase